MIDTILQPDFFWFPGSLIKRDEIAREALRLAAMKLPVKTRVVVREDW